MPTSSLVNAPQGHVALDEGTVSLLTSPDTASRPMSKTECYDDVLRLWVV